MPALTTSQALGSAANQILFTTAPALTLGTTSATGILPWATVNLYQSLNDFATYSPTSGIVAFSNYATSTARRAG